jgi:hypothetical protein
MSSTHPIDLTTELLAKFLTEKGGYLPLLVGPRVACIHVSESAKKFVARQRETFLGLFSQTDKDAVEPSQPLSQTLLGRRVKQFQFTGTDHDDNHKPVHFLVNNTTVYVAFSTTGGQAQQARLSYVKAQLKPPVIVCTCSVLASNHAFQHLLDKSFGCGNYEVVSVYGGITSFITSSETSEAYSDIKLGALRSLEALAEDFNERHGVSSGVPVEVYLIDHTACKPFQTIIGRSDKEVAAAIAKKNVGAIGRIMHVRHTTMLTKVRDAVDMFMRESPNITSIVPMLYIDGKHQMQRV